MWIIHNIFFFGIVEYLLYICIGLNEKLSAGTVDYTDGADVRPFQKGNQR